MEYVYNYKKKCLEPAKCRHCKLFVWSNYQSWTGYCSQLHEKRSNSSLACDHFDCREWLCPPKPIVQLNLFNDEKSV